MLKLVMLELVLLFKRPLFYISVAGVIIVLCQETFQTIPYADSLPNVYVFIGSVGLGLIGLIAPALCVIPYGAYFCKEIKEKNYYYISIRKRKDDYLRSRFISGIISSGITLSIGFLVYELFISIVFIPVSPATSLDLSGSMWENIYATGGGFYFFMYQTIIAFVYGSYCGGIGMMTAAMTMDKYATIAVPFIFNYYVIYFAQRFGWKGMDLGVAIAPTLTSASEYFNVLLSVIIIFIVSYIIYFKTAMRRIQHG